MNEEELNARIKLLKDKNNKYEERIRLLEGSNYTAVIIYNFLVENIKRIFAGIHDRLIKEKGLQGDGIVVFKEDKFEEDKSENILSVRVGESIIKTGNELLNSIDNYKSFSLSKMIYSAEELHKKIRLIKVEPFNDEIFAPKALMFIGLNTIIENIENGLGKTDNKSISVESTKINMAGVDHYLIRFINELNKKKSNKLIAYLTNPDLTEAILKGNCKPITFKNAGRLPVETRLKYINVAFNCLGGFFRIKNEYNEEAFEIYIPKR